MATFACVTEQSPAKLSLKQLCICQDIVSASFYDAAYTVKTDIMVSELVFRADWVIRNELDVIPHQLSLKDVEFWEADAMFVDAHTIRLTTGTAKRIGKSP